MHTVKYHGRVIVFENVTAQVCSVWGEILLSLVTVEAIEAMLKNQGQLVCTAPVYEMPNVVMG